MPPNGNGAAPVYYAARPVIKVDGSQVTELGDQLLSSLFVEETTLGLFRCEARFSNWGPSGSEVFRFFDGQVLDFGKELTIEMGPPEEQRMVFNGRITALEGLYPRQQPPDLVVLAEDRFQDLRMQRRSRVYEDRSDSDIVNQIASKHGLTAEVDADGPTYSTLVQFNQSDLAFLRERAAAVDAELWIEGRSLHFQARSRRDAGTLELAYGSNLLEFSVLADLAHQRTSVTVRGWDIGTKQAMDYQAGESTIQGELNSLRSGSALLAQALAERHEQVVCDVPLSQAEAQALAEARYRQRARCFLTATGQTDGTSALRVGATVSITELGPYFDGDYYVTLARHAFDLEDGYRTIFEAERPGLGS